MASGDFERVILGNLTAGAHFVVLLTPSALEHCNEPDDWLRREMETALNTQRNIVPVMLEGSDFATPERLRWRYLDIPLNAVLHPASLDAKRGTIEQMTATERAPKVQQSELSAQQWFERPYHAVDPTEEEQFYSEAPPEIGLRGSRI